MWTISLTWVSITLTSYLSFLSLPLQIKSQSNISTRSSSIRKLNSVHYRVLRVVENDWKKKKKRSQLDTIGRARPSLWAKYALGNFVIKTLKYSLPVDLHNALHRTLFSERRRPQRAKFFDSSKSKIGYQAVQNRIGALFDTLNFDNFEIILTDNAIRILLKNTLVCSPEILRLKPRRLERLKPWRLEMYKPRRLDKYKHRRWTRSMNWDFNYWRRSNFIKSY